MINKSACYNLNKSYLKLRIFAYKGEIKKARKILKEMLGEPDMYELPGLLAVIYGHLGEMDEAIKWYKKAIENHSPFVLIRLDWARCDNLTNDPRVQKML